MTKLKSVSIRHSSSVKSCCAQPLLAKKRYLAHRLVSLALPQHIAVLLKRAAVQLPVRPQIRRQETIRVRDRSEGSLERVLERLGRAGG